MSMMDEIAITAICVSNSLPCIPREVLYELWKKIKCTCVPISVVNTSTKSKRETVLSKCDAINHNCCCNILKSLCDKCRADTHDCMCKYLGHCPTIRGYNICRAGRNHECLCRSDYTRDKCAAENHCCICSFNIWVITSNICPSTIHNCMCRFNTDKCISFVHDCICSKYEQGDNCKAVNHKCFCPSTCISAEHSCICFHRFLYQGKSELSNCKSAIMKCKSGNHTCICKLHYDIFFDELDYEESDNNMEIEEFIDAYRERIRNKNVVGAGSLFTMCKHCN